MTSLYFTAFDGNVVFYTKLEDAERAAKHEADLKGHTAWIHQVPTAGESFFFKPVQISCSLCSKEIKGYGASWVKVKDNRSAFFERYLFNVHEGEPLFCRSCVDELSS